MFDRDHNGDISLPEFVHMATSLRIAGLVGECSDGQSAGHKQHQDSVLDVGVQKIVLVVGTANVRGMMPDVVDGLK